MEQNKETLNFWKQISHVMKYFREDENPSARLPNTFMQGFLEVSLFTALDGRDFNERYVRVEIDKILQFNVQMHFHGLPAGSLIIDSLAPSPTFKP